MSYVTEHPLAVFNLVIAIFLGVTSFRIAWREDWGWIWGILVAAIPVTLTFFCFPLGTLGAAAFVGKLYMAYG
jgi:hypothetical protein